MNKIVLSLFLLFGLTLPGFAGERSYNFKVTGLYCDMCAKMAEKAAKDVKGVLDVKATLIDGKWENGANLTVKADDSVKSEAIKRAVEKANKTFRVEEIKEAE